MSWLVLALCILQFLTDGMLAREMMRDPLLKPYRFETGEWSGAHNTFCHWFLCLSFCLSLCLSLCLSVFLFVSLSLSLSLFVTVSLCLSLMGSTFQHVGSLICVSVHSDGPFSASAWNPLVIILIYVRSNCYNKTSGSAGYKINSGKVAINKLTNWLLRQFSQRRRSM